MHRPPVAEGERLHYHTVRQRLNVNDAYRTFRHDWFVSIDADEFLMLRRSMTEILSAVPATVDTLRTPVLERAFRSDVPIRSIFDGVWRAPVSNRMPLMKWIYGPQLDFLTQGLLGHALGKGMTRAGRDLRIDIHIAVPTTETARPKDLYARPEYQVWAHDVPLLHFYAMTPTHYLLKMLRKMVDWRAVHNSPAKARAPAVPPPRKKQYRRIYDNSANAAVMAEMSRLLFLSRWQRGGLQMLRALKTAAPLIEATAQEHFPHLDLDFSPAQFDRRLRDRYADVIEATRYAAPTF